MTAKSNKTDIQSWLTGENRPVALHLCQPLIPVEGSEAVIFPPTYAGSPDSKSYDRFKKGTNYNIDELPDGTCVATIDSVGSQANRMEPMFGEGKYTELVPQITFKYMSKDPGVDKGELKERTLSILEAGHRLGDAIVRCTELGSEAHDAFVKALAGDVSDLARLGPTSLVFGVWDSRGTQAKFPRVVQSVVRAWDISVLRRSAQFNPAIDYKEADVFTDKEYESNKNALSQRGYRHAPAVDTHGGIIAKKVKRDVTVNLLALTALKAGGKESELHSYILGLALLAATKNLDYSLRAGCLLVPDADSPATLNLIRRDGTKEQIELDEKTAYEFAADAAKKFGKGDDRTVAFDKEMAKKDAREKAKKDPDA